MQRLSSRPTTDPENLASLLREALPVPEPNRSEEQHDRYHHLDLDQAVIPDLERELIALQLLNHLGAGEAWHELREDRIRELLAERRPR